jgi:serine phosphatase RsbU (regulator of sigma subunit)
MVGVAMGDVPGRGVDATAVKSDMRMALRAYAAQQGHSPSRVLSSLDELVAATGIGEMTTVVYLTINLATGQVCLASAGHCPPLVVDSSGSASFLEEGGSVPLGTVEDVERPEALFQLPVGSTLLLFTDGLVEGRRRPIPDGLAQLRRAAANGPVPLDVLCEHLLRVCVNGQARDDDVSLLALRRLSELATPS